MSFSDGKLSKKSLDSTSSPAEIFQRVSSTAYRKSGMARAAGVESPNASSPSVLENPLNSNAAKSRLIYIYIHYIFVYIMDAMYLQ